MNAKKVLILSLLVAGAAIITGMVVVAGRNKDGGVVALARSGQTDTASNSTREISESPLPMETPPPKTQPQVQTPKADVPPVEALQNLAAQAAKPAKPKEPIQDPAARVALSLVGADANAEEYWFAAINDPTLPANERKDLIEDLNEDGLSNPKRPGPQDLPLILSRIQLIETLAPYAMDQVNANAFAEAYKDLVNLAAAQPVR